MSLEAEGVDYRVLSQALQNRCHENEWQVKQLMAALKMAYTTLRCAQWDSEWFVKRNDTLTYIDKLTK